MQSQLRKAPILRRPAGSMPLRSRQFAFSPADSEQSCESFELRCKGCQRIASSVSTNRLPASVAMP